MIYDICYDPLHNLRYDTVHNEQMSSKILKMGNGGTRVVALCTARDAAYIKRALEYWDVYGEADLKYNQERFPEGS